MGFILFTINALYMIYYICKFLNLFIYLFGIDGFFTLFTTNALYMIYYICKEIYKYNISYSVFLYISFFLYILFFLYISIFLYILFLN